jgi:hypothetical protein
VLFRVFASMLALLFTGPAWAAAVKVVPKYGEVRIGTGRGFQKINTPTDVPAGAQVMVSPEGSASIAYSDNCVVNAPPASITIVEKRPPCREYAEPSYFGFAQSNQEGLIVSGNTFGFTPKVDAPDNDNEPAVVSEPQKPAPAPLPSPPPATPTVAAPTGGGSTWLVVGGVVVGAGALAAILASSGGDDGPASP